MEFMLNQALATTTSEKVKAKIEEELKCFKEEEDVETIDETTGEIQEDNVSDEVNEEVVIPAFVTEETDVIVNVDGTTEEVVTNAVEIVEEHFELDGVEDTLDETEIKTDTDAEAV